MEQAWEAMKHGYFDFYSPYRGHSGCENTRKHPKMARSGQCFSGVADEDGKVRGAEGSRTLAMDPLWAAAVLCNGGCSSLRRLGSKRQSGAAIVTPGCLGDGGKGSGLNSQDERK